MRYLQSFKEAPNKRRHAGLVLLRNPNPCGGRYINLFHVIKKGGLNKPPF